MLVRTWYRESNPLLLSVFQSTLIVEFHGQVLRLKWDLETRELSYFKGEMGNERPFGFLDSNLTEIMHKEMPLKFVPPKRFLINQMHLDNERNACVVH